MGPLKLVYRFFSSFGLAVFTLFGLFLITWLGTLDQAERGIYASQKDYFEAWIVTQPLPFGLKIWLPGGFSLMFLLTINLICGGIVRLKKDARRVFVLITHLGIIMMMAGAGATYLFSDEGGLQLFEGERSAVYHSYHHWEIVVEEPLADGTARQYLVPNAAIVDRTGTRTLDVAAPELPFEWTIAGFLPHSDVQRVPPIMAVPEKVVGGFRLKELAPEKEAERHLAGCYVAVRAPGEPPTEGILWGGAVAPWTVTVGGRSFGIKLRKQQLELPFTVQLDHFTVEFHPNTRKPREFMSDVTVLDDDGSDSQLKIRMNEPLRRDTTTVYQSSWGPPDFRPGDPLYSGFSVVRNPAEGIPLWSLAVITIGLIAHLTMKLIRFLSRETSRSSASGGAA